MQSERRRAPTNEERAETLSHLFGESFLSLDAVDSEVGCYVPLVLGLVNQLRGLYTEAEDNFRAAKERVETLLLKRPADPSEGRKGKWFSFKKKKITLPDDPTLGSAAAAAPGTAAAAAVRRWCWPSAATSSSR